VTTVHGDVEEGFGPVADAFRRNFTHHGEVGAACSVYADGRKVVDLWGGVADPRAERPWTEDTLQLVFSCTKGATAACANLLMERGELDPDAPVATYWPEFATAGKESIPVRWLLCHKAGLPDVDRPVTFEGALTWDPVVHALAAQAPMWEPGTAHGYHAVTWGWLVGEVIRRVSGRSVGRFFAEEIAGPLGLSFWIGLPEELQGRVSRLTTRDPRDERGGAPVHHRAVTAAAEGPAPAETKAARATYLDEGSLTARALVAPAGALSGGVWNRPEVHRAEIPSANGIADARSLARLYAGLVGEVDGVRILGEDQVRLAREPQTSGHDKVLFFETVFGLGFMLTSEYSPYGAPDNFGHAGAGGSLGFGDPVRGLGFGYVMNRMHDRMTRDPRAFGLTRAVYRSIGEPHPAT
jgi:CubicO group peptidase (beta-lactamase class C family)